MRRWRGGARTGRDTRRRRTLIRWTPRRVLVTLLCLAILTTTGMVYQDTASAHDLRAYPAPGRLIDIGGYRLNLACSGHGRPTVVLDSGLGEGYLAWSGVQPLVARTTRVCAYDRAGIGWSDLSPLPRTSRVIAQELHTLLQRAGEPGPYILVGHSFGGLTMQMYAHLYPRQVAGMVLAESVSPEQHTVFAKAFGVRAPLGDVAQNVNDALYRYAARVGLVRLATDTGLLATPPLDVYPAALRPALRAQFVGSRLYAAVYGEQVNFDASQDQVRATHLALGATPLVVITRGQPFVEMGDLERPMGRLWTQMQGRLCQLSRRCTHLIAPYANHGVIGEQPDLVASAITRLVQQARGRVAPA